MVDDFERSKDWGSITVVFKDGSAHTVEKRVTYSLNGAAVKGLPRDAHKPQS